MILFLLGRREDGVKAYGELVDRKTKGWYGRIYEYWGERRSAARILEEAGPSRWKQCEAHYAIGMKLLAEGDKVGPGPLPEIREHTGALVPGIRMEPRPAGADARSHLAAVDSGQG